MRRFVFTALPIALCAFACQPRQDASFVDVENPFLIATIESFRLAARDGMLNGDEAALANQVFLLKRTVPTAWAVVVDSTGTVLMHSDPANIAKVPSDALSVESLAYSDHDRPLVRRLWSTDRRPVLDFTLPVSVGANDRERTIGYVRVGFFAGSAARSWAAPPTSP